MRCRALVTLLFAALGVLPTQTLAGEYVLERGANVPACMAYAMNLQRVSADPVRQNNTCPIPIAEDLTELQEAGWIDLNDDPPPLPPDLDLFAQIDRFLWQRDANPVVSIPAREWPEWRGTARQLQSAFASYTAQRERYHSEPAVRLAYATLDIDNDGIEEPVYRDNHNCQYIGVGTLLVVLNADYSGIDRIKTERVLVHPARAAGAAYFRPLRSGERGALLNGSRLDFAPLTDPSRGMEYGAFVYRGKTFITVTGLAPNQLRSEGHALHVYLHENGSRSEVCTYRFDE